MPRRSGSWNKMTDDVDRVIERLYYKHCQGTQIAVLDIPKLFDDCYIALEEGRNIEEAVVDAIAKYSHKEKSA